jgi:hypothetical protein
MTTTVDMVRLDADIAEAWTQVLAARVAWSRSPNADSVTREAKAEAALDKLLEFRFAVTQAEPLAY